MKELPLTQAMVRRYNRIVDNINKTRRELLKRRKKAEEETRFGRPSSMPELIIPARQRRIKIGDNITRKEYYDFIKRYSEIYSSDKSIKNFYKQNYKNNYLEALLNIIESTRDESIRPEGRFKEFTKKQINDNPEFADFMKMYNNILKMAIEKFMLMYDLGYILKLKYFYLEMSQEIKEYSFLEEQKELFKDFNSQVYKNLHKSLKNTKSSVKSNNKRAYSGEKRKSGRYKNK